MKVLELTSLFLLGITIIGGQNAQARIPPKILGEEEVFGDEEATLICEGSEPLSWTHKYLDKESSPHESAVSSSSPNETHHVSTLELTDQDEQGLYYCHYNNTNLNDTSQATSVYVYLFSTSDGFGFLYYDTSEPIRKINQTMGGTVVLDCRPTKPDLNVTVIHSDKVIHDGVLDEPRLGYVIRNVQKEHDGDYTCIISEEDAMFKVKVKGELEQPTLNIEKNTYAVVDYDLELWCRILDRSYASSPVFKWMTPNEDTRNSSRSEHGYVRDSLFFTEFLRVSNVTLEDSGTYTCTVKVPNNLPTNGTLDITVKESMEPFLDIPPFNETLTCNEGDNITWHFDIESFPPGPQLHYDDKRFTSTPSDNGNTNLTIFGVKPSDFGNHTLRVTTKNNQVSENRTLFLTVRSKTQLTITGVEKPVKPYTEVKATCSARAYPLQNITWWRQSCPEGRCPKSFEMIKNATNQQVQGNFQKSTYTFVASELAKVVCKSGNVNKTAFIVVSERESKYNYSFKLGQDHTMMEVQSEGTSHTLTERDSFTMICAASKHYFNNLILEFESKDKQGKQKSVDQSTDFTFIKNISIPLIKKTDEGKYLCSASPSRNPTSVQRTLTLKVDEFIPVYFTDDSNMKPDENTEVTMAAKESFDFKCSVKGTPDIKITWMKDDAPLTKKDSENFDSFSDNGSLIAIRDLNNSKHTGKYQCTASNSGGHSVTGFLKLTVRVSSQAKLEESTKVILGIVGVGILVLIVVVLVLAFRVRKDTLKRKETKRNLAFFFERGRPTELNPDCTADEQAELLPYDRKWEISKDRIQLGKQLGSGAFGRVVKAAVSNLVPGIPQSTVALKMCKAQEDAAQVKALAMELKIMLHLGKHLNIVNLVGAHTSRVSRGELWILVEYCKYGSLLSFLHGHKTRFVNVIDPATDTIKLTSACGATWSPFSPAEVVSSSKEPNSPTSFELEAYESSHSTSSGVTRPLIPSVASPHSPTELSSSGNPVNTADGSVKERQSNTPGVFNFGTGLPSVEPPSTSMIQNPAYQSVPMSQSTSPPIEEDSDKRTTGRMVRKESLLAQDSQGNYFMYDKSAIPGVASAFTTIDLLCWSWQVAEGMEYLSRRKVLHGDLAARNLLLSQDNVVKISDFGLSRDIYKSDIYVKQTNELMPVKWMSIEAIRDRIFTIQSDVWSFGVTVWELFTLGSTPYPGVTIDHTFLQSLEEGYRMEKPKWAHKELYQLLQQCWETCPNSRPDFRYLANRLSQMLMPETTQHYNEKNDEYLNFNKELFKTETDYLDMLSSPDFKNLCKDQISQGEEAVEGAIAVPNDTSIGMDRPGSSTGPLSPRVLILSEPGYLPMSSCSGSPAPNTGIFSPTRTVEGSIFTFNKDTIDEVATKDEKEASLGESLPEIFPEKADKKHAPEDHQPSVIDGTYVNIPSLASEEKASSSSLLSLSNKGDAANSSIVNHAEMNDVAFLNNLQTVC